MPKNQMGDLRNHLFETIERLLDEDNPLEVERAEKVAKVAQTIINSRKLEVDAFKAVAQYGNEMPNQWNEYLLLEADNERNRK